MSAVADEELGPKLTFEIADLLRERRSSKVKALCRPTEMQFLGNGDKVGQLPEFHGVDSTAGVIGGAYHSLVISRGPKTTTRVYSDTENAPDQVCMRSSEATMMEFLVQFELDIPDGVAESEVEDRERAETAAAETLADKGHLVRLWRASVGTSQPTVLGLYRAGSKAELDELLGALPLFEWMRTSITPLVQHPNDPARIRAIAQ